MACLCKIPYFLFGPLLSSGKFTWLVLDPPPYVRGGHEPAGLTPGSRGFTADAITEFKPNAGSDPAGITVGADGNLWYTETDPGKLAMLPVSSQACPDQQSAAGGALPEYDGKYGRRRLYTLKDGTKCLRDSGVRQRALRALAFMLFLEFKLRTGSGC